VRTAFERNGNPTAVLDTHEAAAYLAIKEWTLHRLIRDGDLPHTTDAGGPRSHEEAQGGGMSTQRYIIVHKKRAGSNEKTGGPDHVRPLLVRLMGGVPLDLVERDLVHAYQKTLKAKKKDTP